LEKLKTMKPKRVECNNCQNFIEPDFKISFNLIKLTKDEKAKCKLGKRIMYRKPDIGFSGYPFDTGGYFRYCDDFKSKTN